MAIYSTEVNIGQEKKFLTIINHVKEKGKEVSGIHYIHILDRSGSMSGSIRPLIENVKKTVDFMQDTDYLSIVWFSSHDECGVLLKGAKKDLNTKKLLDTIASTIGCTCFSTPLKETAKIIDELSVICSNYSVTLFTDGCPVVPWSEEEEKRKIFEAIDLFKDKIISLNCIGYSDYYNKDLLVEMASKSYFGEFIHSSNINEYYSFFESNYDKIKELEHGRVDISTSATCDILYLNRKFSKLSKGSFNLNMLDKEKNQFVMISDAPIVFRYNDVDYRSEDFEKEKVDKRTVTNILYAYAYELYYRNARKKAIDILLYSLKDKNLVDSQMSAYTNSEVANYLKILKSSVFNNSKRMLTGETPDNYLPADNEYCIMDLFKDLEYLGARYIPIKNYQRIGIERKETFNVFEKDDSMISSSFKNLVFNEEMLNVSIRYSISGNVTLNPKSAERANLDKTIPATMWKNHTFIKDGSLNISEFTILAPEGVIQEISNKTNKLGFPVNEDLTVYKIADEESGEIIEYRKHALVISSMPVINAQYAKEGTLSNIITSVDCLEKHKAIQKTINYYLNKLKEDFSIAGKEKEFKNYTLEQIEVLKEHGLDKNLWYNGVAKEAVEKKEEDYYIARSLKFQLAGCSSIPSVDDVLKKVADGKVDKLNYLGRVIYDFIKYHLKDIDLEVKSLRNRDKLNALLVDVKKAISEDRYWLNTIRLAKILTNDFFEGAEFDGKNYNYSEKGLTLVIKSQKEKIFF